MVVLSCIRSRWKGANSWGRIWATIGVTASVRHSQKTVERKSAAPGVLIRCWRAWADIRDFSLRVASISHKPSREIKGFFSISTVISCTKSMASMVLFFRWMKPLSLARVSKCSISKIEAIFSCINSIADLSLFIWLISIAIVRMIMRE